MGPSTRREGRQKTHGKFTEERSIHRFDAFCRNTASGYGAWTGTLAASMLDFGMKKSAKAVMVGVLMAGIIMLVISLLAKAGITSVSDLF